MFIIIQNYYTDNQQARPVYDKYGRVATFLSYDEARRYCDKNQIGDFVICKQKSPRLPVPTHFDSEAKA